MKPGECEGVSKVMFDFYPTSVNEYSFKKGVDDLPEFDIDFGRTVTVPLKEEKPGRDRGGKKVLYFPGFEVKIKTVRNPFSKIIRAFLPAIILDIFLYFTFDINEYS